MTDLIRRADVFEIIGRAFSQPMRNGGTLYADICLMLNALPTHANSRSTHERDLISRADAIEAICMNDCGGCRPNECGAYLDKSCDVVKVLSALPSADAVSREDIIGYIDRVKNSGIGRKKALEYICKYVERTESAEAVQGWIPIKYHEITEIERKENGYPKDWVYFLDCEMPQDEQEILVQAKNGEIRWDVCYEDDGFSLDSGWDWKDDIIAWMPLPKPYKGGDDE